MSNNTKANNNELRSKAKSGLYDVTDYLKKMAEALEESLYEDEYYDYNNYSLKLVKKALSDLDDIMLMVTCTEDYFENGEAF